MVNSNVDALGILFPNSYDSFVPELVAERSDGLDPLCRPLPDGGLSYYPVW